MADEKARDAKPGSRNPTNGRFEGGSGNPLGRPKALPMFRSRCRERTDERVFAAWVDEIEVRERVVGHAFGAPIIDVCRGKEWIRASELLAAYGYGKPAQAVSVDVTHHRDVRELSRDELMAIASGIEAGAETEH